MYYSHPLGSLWHIVSDSGWHNTYQPIFKYQMLLHADCWLSYFSPWLAGDGLENEQLTWCSVKLYTRHMSNTEVRRTTGCSPLSHLVTNRHLWLFGHIARSSPREDHHRALAVCIRQVPPDCKRPAGRPSHTWLRAIEADFGLATAWRKATTRDEWWHIVDAATLQRSTLWKKRKSMKQI